MRARGFPSHHGLSIAFPFCLSLQAPIRLRVPSPVSKRVRAAGILQSLEGENGIELGDSWLDWINWKYLGYHDPEKHLDIPFVPDRNAGVWKRCFSAAPTR